MRKQITTERRKNTTSRTTSKAQVRRKKAGKKNLSAAKGISDPVRLNKLIADSGVASRRHADELIEKGRVKINGEVVTELGRKAHPGDDITVDGEPISYRRHLTYIILNKPKNVITTTSDEKGRKTVIDMVPSTQRLFPVGRLDRETTGLLLLTNDGEIAHRLLHPSYEVPRVYKVGLDKPINTDDAKAISNGVELEDGVTSPCEVFFEDTDATTVYIELKEGKNREVRRIFAAKGYDVKKLERKSYANLTIRGMKRGTYRHLTKEEIRGLEAAVGLDIRSQSSQSSSPAPRKRR